MSKKSIAIGGIAAIAATASLTACSTRTVTGPTVTKTVTVAAAPAVTVTITAAPVTAPAVTRTVTAAPATPAAISNQVLTRFNGSGTQNTQAFTSPTSWHLSWSYWGCPSGSSNFIVEEYNADGSLDTSGVNVNEIGTGGGPVATYAYGDPGTHYFSVNTEGCSWSLVPVTG